MNRFCLVCSAVLALFSAAISQEKEITADLDPLITLPAAYNLTPDQIPEMYPKGNWNKNPHFEWLTEDKSRAIFKRHLGGGLEVDLTILDGTVPVQEAVLDFKDGKFLGVTFSIHNRGDGRSIESAEFSRRFKEVGRHLGTQLAARPQFRKGNERIGILSEGYIWMSARGMAVLEYDLGTKADGSGKKEFLRMRLAKREAKGMYAAAMQTRPQAVKAGGLVRNVKKTPSGDIYVDNVPMVDQGAKGYCVVASAQRLFEYYGIPCDMHQLAVLTKADPDQGTSPLLTNEQLGGIDHLFKTRFTCIAIGHNNSLVELVDNKYVGDRVEYRDFHKAVTKSVDEGIPLLWSLHLGIAPEEPAISPQASGGHMRMIIGYNDKEEKYIFSDSWGAGHEFKKMTYSDTFKVTKGLFLMRPTTR
ncbi:MAG: C39 family peptidase [Verrucomicrobiota bacterium]